MGHLKKGLNPISIKGLNFRSDYLVAPIKAGLVTGILATTVRRHYSHPSNCLFVMWILTTFSVTFYSFAKHSRQEGIAIGRTFAMMKNEQTDGNKEMIAFGLMNIVGSFTSCYLTTGPFFENCCEFQCWVQNADGQYSDGTLYDADSSLLGSCL